MFEKYAYNKFYENPFSGRRADRQTDRQTDMTKLIVAVRSFAKAPIDE
jgi:hypothetical protein